MIKKTLLLLSVTTFLLQSCITKKNTIYMQSASYPVSVKTGYSFEPTIKKDNILSIEVSGESPEAASIFNLTSSTTNINVQNAFTAPTKINYLVDNQGFIEMPILGKIKADGLKKSELEEIIKKEVEKYVTKPLILIRILNYRVYVEGEVNRPGEQLLNNGERVTLIEAITRAGDLTINGNRKRVKVIRQNESVTTTSLVDLTTPDFINSELYYLQQNDVVYVEPNGSRLTTASLAPISVILGTVSSLLTLYIVVQRL